MAETSTLHDPWLIAAWPGMGNVAVVAAGYLIVKLGARLVHELPSRDLFDVPHIEVKDGIAKAGRLPRNMIFEWKNPRGGRDLMIFIGEAQPTVGGYALCHRLLDFATQRNASRLFTFAAMASQLHPSNTPRVFGATTDQALLTQLQSVKVKILKEGQISGLNGVLLAAGAERSVPGVCLLGELPYFAAGVPNPKASLAVLEVFCALSGIDIDLAEIKEQASAVERGLIQLLEKLQEAARQQAESGEEGFTVPEFAQPGDDDEDEDDETDAPSAGPSNDQSKKQEKSLDYGTRRRIDSMFEAAHQDRSKAVQLKHELDRLGVFEQYEDRFLDLFRKAE